MTERHRIPVIGELIDKGEPEPVLTPAEREAERQRVLKMLAEERARKKAARSEG
jgi:hypothetical protein